MATLQTVLTRTALVGLILSWIHLQATAAVLQVPSQYPNIQAAVDAATFGDEIRIAAGTYTEQVMITSKDLSLIGEPGAVLKAFPGMTPTWILGPDGERRILLLALFCDRVTVRGLTVDGGRLADENSGLFGVIFHGSGGEVANCTIKGIRGDAELGPWGIGLGAANWASLNRGQLQLQVRNNTFEDNVLSIYMYAGNEGGAAELRLQFQIAGNVIRGVGPTAAGAQTGIQLREGTGGEVMHNLISGHNYTGPDILFSLGIHAQGFGETLFPIRYVENVFKDNQVHLGSFFSSGAQFVANTFEGPGAGAFNIGIASSGSTDRIAANTFRRLTSGVLLVGDDPVFGTTLGIASDAMLMGNRFCEVSAPIVVEPLLTGVEQQGNRLNDCHESSGENDPH